MCVFVCVCVRERDGIKKKRGEDLGGNDTRCQEVNATRWTRTFTSCIVASEHIIIVGSKHIHTHTNTHKAHTHNDLAGRTRMYTCVCVCAIDTRSYVYVRV